MTFLPASIDVVTKVGVCPFSVTKKDWELQIEEILESP
jgi:hypothetical protein